MTEAEARTKWCPFVRIGNYLNGGSLNREANGEISDNMKCIGSDCMGWRWVNSEVGFCRIVGNP